MNKDQSFKELLTGSAQTMIVKALGIIIGYVFLLVLSKLFQSEGVGVYTLAFQILNVLSVLACLGLNISVLRFIGEFKSDGNSALKKLFIIAVKFVLPSSTLLGGILFFGAEYLESIFESKSLLAGGIKMIAVAIPLNTMLILVIEFIRGLKLIAPSEVLRSVLRPTFMMILVSLSFFYDLKSTDLLWMLAISCGLSLTLGLLLLVRYFRNTVSTDLPMGKSKILKTSLPLMVSFLFSALMTSLPVFFLGSFFDNSTVGVFGIGFRLASGVGILLAIVNTISAPKFAELYWSQKHEDLEGLIFKTSKLLFWLAFLLSLMLIALGPWILGIFGDEFSTKTSYWVLVVLVLGQLVNVSAGSVGVYLSMTGKQVVLRNVILVVTSLSLLAYWLFTKEHGIKAVALISSSSLILLNLVLVLYTYFKLKLITFYIPGIKWLIKNK